MGRGSGFPGCTTFFPDIFELVILSYSFKLDKDVRSSHIMVYTLMDLRAKSDVDVVHGITLGSSVSTYD